MLRRAGGGHPQVGGRDMEPVRQAKRALRTQVLAARRTAPRGNAGEGARHLAPLLMEITTVAGYLALPGEAELDLEGGERRVLLPRLLVDGDLAWVRLSPGGARLGPGLRGTREPLGPPDPEGLAAADLVVVPALAVDRTGVRLGRGGGSYDRALRQVRPGVLVVAVLARDDELVERLPVEPHDAAVGAVVTPSGLIRLPMASARG